MKKVSRLVSGSGVHRSSVSCGSVIARSGVLVVQGSVFHWAGALGVFPAQKAEIRQGGRKRRIFRFSCPMKGKDSTGRLRVEKLRPG